MQANNYDEFISNILAERGRFNCGDEYHERHHIISRCMGGTNDKENLIDLYAHEHYIAHKLLALENPDHDGLTYAWSCMAFFKKDGQRYELTPDEYEEVRIALSKVLTGRKFSDETREKIRQARLGTKYSKECREKMSLSRRGEKSYWYGKHFTDEMKKKLSETRKGKYVGEMNPNVWQALVD